MTNFGSWWQNFVFGDLGSSAKISPRSPSCHQHPSPKWMLPRILVPRLWNWVNETQFHKNVMKFLLSFRIYWLLCHKLVVVINFLIWVFKHIVQHTVCNIQFSLKIKNYRSNSCSNMKKISSVQIIFHTWILHRCWL